MTDRLLRIWLSTKESITPRIAAQLIDHFGDPAHIYAADRTEFLACSFLRAQHVEALCEKDLGPAEILLRTCEREHIAVLTPGDPLYPDRLHQIPDPPQVLYVRGRMPDFDRAPGIAIIGTRNCSAYGLTQARKFGAALAEAGFTVVTGMALGVDGAANRGALHVGRPTAAVLAGGVDICYPPKHRGLMGDILIDGAVISEQPPGTPHMGKLFPVRNRIISGLCAATLVIEAPLHSGALITADLALDQGREVFALPGSVDSAFSAGSNRLLRDGAASIVLEPMDIVHALAGQLRALPDTERIREIYLRESGGQEPTAGTEPKPSPEANAQPDEKLPPVEQPVPQKEKKTETPPAAKKPRPEKKPYT
ncbi:MAG: DNA-processing protein DprA, partial [Butyricicoccus sp.]|nr:DNA-processing protein DprA [Butyricicoccus sp.]